MTVKQAERILGFDVDLIAVEEDHGGKRLHVAYAASSNWEHGTVTIKDRSKDIAVQMLVNRIYALRSAWVMKQQKYRCANCGELNRLEIDHKVPRAKGRDDRIENLQAVCASFTGCRIHERKHGG